MENETATPQDNVITLQFPMTLPSGQRVERLSMRRAKVRDMKHAQKRGATTEEREIVLFSSLCQPSLTPEDLEEMDLADYGQIQRRFQDMVGRA
jgi:hypothetical protein